MPLKKDTIAYLRGLLDKRGFHERMIPIVICSEDLHVIDKTAGADIFQSGFRLSMDAGKNTDENALRELEVGEIDVNHFFEKDNGEASCMIAYKTTIGGICCCVLAFPSLIHDFRSLDDPLSITKAATRVKFQIRSELSSIVGDDLPDKMFDISRICKNTKRLQLLTFNMRMIGSSELMRVKNPVNIYSFMRYFSNEFITQMRPYNVSVNLETPDSDQIRYIEVNNDGVISFFSFLLMNLLFMSSNRSIKINFTKVNRSSVEIEFSTLFRSNVNGVDFDSRIYSGEHLTLDSLSAECMRMSYPFAIDILVASDFLDIYGWSGYFTCDGEKAVIHLSMLVESESVYMSDDISFSAPVSTAISDLLFVYREEIFTAEEINAAIESANDKD